MKKLITALIFLIIVVAAVIGFYQTFDRNISAPSISLKAIPQSAALIIETDEAGELWRDLAQTNVIWEELKTTDFYFRLDAAVHAIDSLLARQKDFRGYIADKPVAVSVHVSGARHYDYLLSIQLENNANTEQIAQGVRTLFGVDGTVDKRLYDGVEIHKISPRLFDAEVFFFVNNGLLVMSMASILVEESIRALQQEASVMTNPAFSKVRETRGRDSRGEVYVNYKQLKTILGQYAANEFKDQAFFTQSFADWSALDLNLKPNAVSLNGFVMSKDSSDAWLGAFRNNDAPRMNVLKYMPSNTAYIAFFGFGNFTNFRERQMDIFAKANRKYAVETKTEEYSELCDCNMSQLGLSWIGSQAASFILEPVSENYSQNHFAIFETIDPVMAWSSLLEIEQSRAEVIGKTVEFEEFGDFEIHRLEIGTFYGKVLSEAFSALVDPYFLRIDDMILMATSLNAIRNLAQRLSNSDIKDNILANDAAFMELSDQISGNSHFMVYSSLARSPIIYQNILAEEHAKNLDDKKDLLRKFQAFVYQVNYYKKDLYYNNVYFKYNPEYKKETNSLWEKQLKANVSSKPYLLKNHYTDALEIFVQDENNTVYLISNTGKLLWELEVDGAIKSDVTQIDVYQNEKLQILFSTSKRIYLLDRNGNNVESFPVKLPSNATNGVTTADYDNSRDYRIFVAVEGGKILSYDVTGKQIKGWNFRDASANIVSDVRHLRLKSKDYIFAFNENGNIHLLSRKGEPRHLVGQKIAKPAHGKYQFDLRSKIGESGIYYVDSLGNAYRQGFNDRFTKVKLTDQPILAYDFVDLNNDESIECIILTSESLEGFSIMGDILFANKLEDSDKYQLQTFIFPDNVLRLGITDLENEKITLYDRSGKIRSGFPLYGSQPFAIGDMNRDGYFNLITAGKDGFVYAYAIE